jgi:hypothetical protein
MLGANAIPSDNASPARCFIAFSFCFCNRKKQVLCRLPEFLEFQIVSQRLLQLLSSVPPATIVRFPHRRAVDHCGLHRYARI